MQRNRNKLIIMRSIKIIGIIFVILSIYVFAERIYFYTHAQRTEGTVVYLNKAFIGKMSRHNSSLYFGLGINARSTFYPTVEYSIKNQLYTVNGSIPASILIQYEMDQKVEIIYDANTPNVGFINNSIELWTLPAILLAFGLVFQIAIPFVVSAWSKICKS